MRNWCGCDASPISFVCECDHIVAVCVTLGRHLFLKTRDA